MTEKDKNAQVIFESTLPHTEYSTRLIEERIWYCPARLTGNRTKTYHVHVPHGRFVLWEAKVYKRWQGEAEGGKLSFRKSNKLQFTLRNLVNMIFPA